MRAMMQSELRAALTIYPLEEGLLSLYAWQEEAFEACEYSKA